MTLCCRTDLVCLYLSSSVSPCLSVVVSIAGFLGAHWSHCLPGWFFGLAWSGAIAKLCQTFSHRWEDEGKVKRDRSREREREWKSDIVKSRSTLAHLLSKLCVFRCLTQVHMHVYMCVCVCLRIISDYEGDKWANICMCICVCVSPSLSYSLLSSQCDCIYYKISRKSCMCVCVLGHSAYAQHA